MKSKGFTLIELLVVLAIIGILATVVLSTLSNARGKGADTAIKTNLANMRGEAAIFFNDTNQSYGTPFPLAACNATTAGTLFEDPTMARGITTAGNISNGTGMARGICASTATEWAASVPLKTNATKSWCVDSIGISRENTGDITATNC